MQFFLNDNIRGWRHYLATKKEKEKEKEKKDIAKRQYSYKTTGHSQQDFL